MKRSPVEVSKPIKRVMLIDDDGTDNFLHTRVLNKSGLVDQVIAFEHAEGALDYLRIEEHAVDVIFLDINMPRMNGFEFIEAFQQLQNDGHANTLIVILSTSISPEDVRKATQFSGQIKTETKPLSQTLLESLVQEYFGTSASSGEES